MKKKPLDFRLYAEALRQLRVMSLFCLLPLLFSALYHTLMMYSYWGSVFHTPELRAQNLPLFQTAEDLHPLLPILCLLVAPLLTLKAFSFLNSRKGSDFYHSVPPKMSCVYFSFLAAVWTWLTVLVFGSALAAGLCAQLICPGFFQFSWPELVTYALSCFLCSLYVSAAAACAAALCGTVFTDIIASVLLVFAPRLILYSLGQGILAASDVLLSDHLFFLLDSRFHLPSVILVYLLGQITRLMPTAGLSVLSDTAALYYAPVLWYTAGLALFFLLLGCFCYTRRRSEAAGLAAASPYLNTVFGLLLSLLVCLSPLIQVFQAFMREERQNSAFWFGVGKVFVLAVLLLFLYHVLSERKLSSLKKVLRSLPILLGLNFLLCGIMLLSGIAVRHFRPDTEEIISVRYLGESSLLPGSTNAYFQEKGARTELQNPFLKELCADGLAAILDAKDDNYTHDGRLLKVAIRTKQGDRYRQIFVREEDYQKWMEELAENEEYIRSCRTLPAAGDPSVSLDIDCSLRRSALKDLYAAFRKDSSSVDFPTWNRLLNEPQSAAVVKYTLRVKIREAGRSSELTVPISTEFPDLWKAFWVLQGTESEKIQPSVVTQLERLAAFPIPGNPETSITVRVYRNAADTRGTDVSFTNRKGNWLADGSDSAGEALSALASLLREASGKALDTEQPFTEISLWAPQLEEDGSSTQNNHLHAYFAADPTVLPELAPYLGQDKEPELVPMN